jgi:hypothetical protein
MMTTHQSAEDYTSEGATGLKLYNEVFRKVDTQFHNFTNTRSVLICMTALAKQSIVK